MTQERRVDTYDLTDIDSRAQYEDLINRPANKVLTEQTFPMGDGSVLRIVDYSSPSEVVAEKPAYLPPVC